MLFEHMQNSLTNWQLVQPKTLQICFDHMRAPKAEQRGGRVVQVITIKGPPDIIGCFDRTPAFIHLTMGDDTPLHTAIEKGFADVVESLLTMERAILGSSGMVSTTKMSSNGDLPLAAAIKRGHEKVVETLLNFMDADTDAFVALARTWPDLTSDTREEISYFLRLAAQDARHLHMLLGMAPNHLCLPEPENYSLLDHLIEVEADWMFEDGADFSGFVAKGDTIFIEKLHREGLLTEAVHDAIAEEALRLGKQQILDKLDEY